GRGPRPDRRRDRRALRGRADRDRPPQRRGAAGRGLGGRRRGLAPSRRGAPGSPLRDRRHEGGGAHLEGGAVRRRPCLDRRAGADRTRRPMKVYLSVDMEGGAGGRHPTPTARGDTRYPDAVELMIGEANSAIEGAFDGGATEVLVNDS